MNSLETQIDLAIQDIRQQVGGEKVLVLVTLTNLFFALLKEV